MRDCFYKSAISLLLITLFSVGVRGQGQTPVLTIQQLDSPAGEASSGPNLFAGADGRAYMSWIEKKGERTHALRFAVRHRNVWSQPGTIVEAENMLANWADFPSLIALPGGALVAHWMIKSGGDGHAYDVYVSRSADGGKSWQKPALLHRDGTKTEHGFVSMLPSSGGRAAAAWLDGRNFQQSSHDGHGAAAKEMTLRHAAIGANGQPSGEAVLDPRVCECCQTSAAMTSAGPIVVYRDRSDKEVRDISIVRQVKGRWTEPRTLHADGWEINGCPVNGPSIAADGRRVAVAWFTAAKDAPRVKVIFSHDAGESFGQPVQVDDGSPVGRVDVEILADGSALVTWLERTAAGGEIKVRRVRPDGTHDEATTLSASSVARASGFPRMVRSGNEVVFAWTQAGTPSRVRTALVRLGGK